MEQSQVALKLLLDALGVAPTIDKVSQRKAVQKAVYLGQVSGVDLGYRYNWYRMGPYSPGLTRDYFALAGTLAGPDDPTKGFELREPVRAKLASVRPLMAVPDGVSLSQADWLELLASVHFLRARRGLSPAEIRDVLTKEKPHVVSYLNQAIAALQNGGLAA